MPDAGVTSPGTAGASGMTAAPMAGAPSTAEPAAPKLSAGCANGTVKAGRTNETLQVGSARRQYVQTVPTTYDGKQPFRVLLDFHGGTYDGPRWDARASNKFPEMAETERFIYLTPTGLNAWWTTTEGKMGADGQFMTALLEKIKTTACVDERRIYATGCSMGGDMSFYMACYFADQIAAVLPLCGSASFNLEAECKPARPVSVEFVIGSQDTLNCWEPPRTSVGNPCATEVQSVFKTLNKCTGTPKKTFGGVCETLDQCAEGTEVTICMVEAQHTTIYQNPDMDMYKDGWEYLTKYYIH
jgi:polyhydroxybutyrate depolymerase